MQPNRPDATIPRINTDHPFGMIFLLIAGLSAGLLVSSTLAEPSVVARAGETRTVLVGEVVRLDGSASRGASRYHWDFGNERGWDGPRSEAVAEVVYETPGRHQPILTAFDDQGNWDNDFFDLLVIRPPVHHSNHSSSISLIRQTEQVAVVSPDSDEVTLIGRDQNGGFKVVQRFDTSTNPRTVTAWGEWLAIACQQSHRVDLLRYDGSGERWSLALPYGSLPFGVVGTDEALFITLQGPGKLARIELDDDGPRLAAVYDAVPDARGVAELPDGRLAVTRWRSPDTHAEIAVLHPDTGEREIWTLQVDPRSAADELLIERKRIGGLPSYLNQVIVSPDGTYVALPSMQTNVIDGIYRTGTPLTHETTLRATVSFIDLETGQEAFERRWQFEKRGFASSAVFTATGDYLLVASRGARSIDRVDLLNEVKVGRIHDVGFAPEGLTLSADGRYLFVDAYLTREVAIYDITGEAIGLPAVARLPSASFEPLSEELLLGKRLFNDSLDERLTLDHYLACAHCHLDNLTDNRVWDFTHLGEGLRNTISLVGPAGTGDGPIHWSANFDEVQDFEQATRGVFGGTGLMEDEDFFSDCRDEPLGGKKAGMSRDLDALAAFVSSLRIDQPSPYRNADGSLTAAAKRGRRLFESKDTGCSTCHSGARLTDSRFEGDGEARLHDIGTLGPGLGHRSHAVLPGIDTPTLHGVWDTEPYLHDGSAPTVRAVLTTHNPDDRHGKTSHLSERQIADLTEYVLSLDGRRN